jgi:hypothetical protein
MSIELKKLSDKWHIVILNEVWEADYEKLKTILNTLLDLKNTHGHVIKNNNLQPGQMRAYNEQFR